VQYDALESAENLGEEGSVEARARQLKAKHLDTLAVHGGVDIDPSTGVVSPPIHTSVTFAAEYGTIGFSASDTDEELVPFAYAREGHPNAAQLEHRLALLDGGEAAVTFATGIAAITGLILHLLNPGDHLIVSDVSYAGTAEFTRGFLQRKQIEVSIADMSDLDDVERAIQPNTKLIHAETPCNPVIKLVDIAQLAALAHNAGASLVVDGTFATPVVTRPLEHGADFVAYSLTKYMAGHGDALGGAIIGRAEEMHGLRTNVGVHLGATLAPFNCWLTMRGIETLPIRMRAHSERGQVVAEFLEAHPKVEAVRFPGLRSHPQHELAKRQMALPSGMISFRVADAKRFGDGFADHLNLFSFAPSLGLSRSLILECNTESLQRTTFQLDDEHLERYRAFAGDGFFRLSIGLEDPADLCEELNRALSVL
jgi:cystathionine beta-lyase/cystathionine gamma-synthase